MCVFCFQAPKTFIRDCKFSKFIGISITAGVILGSKKGLGVVRGRQLQPLEKPTCHSCRWHHLHHHARVLVRTGLGGMVSWTWIIYTTQMPHLLVLVPDFNRPPLGKRQMQTLFRWMFLDDLLTTLKSCCTVIARCKFAAQYTRKRNLTNRRSSIMDSLTQPEIN